VRNIIGGLLLFLKYEFVLQAFLYKELYKNNYFYRLGFDWLNLSRIFIKRKIANA